MAMEGPFSGGDFTGGSNSYAPLQFGACFRIIPCCVLSRCSSRDFSASAGLGFGDDPVTELPGYFRVFQRG